MSECSPFSPSSSISSLDWLFEQQQRGIVLGCEAITTLLKALGNPEQHLPVFHIAGTNGKGSVSAFAASLLKAAGVRVGLYTSPHLIDFRERIQLEGRMISSEDLDDGIRRLQLATQSWPILPTFFELTTALAFDFFARKKCDVVVLETGLGGRLDATNLASKKIACAITPISLDHQEWLGPRLVDIAREKAGIMRCGVPIVTLPQPKKVMTLLQEEALRLRAPFIRICEPLSENISLGLLGAHQRWNAALALRLVEQGPWKLSPKSKQEGFESVFWPGRFQRLFVKKMQDLPLLAPRHDQYEISALTQHHSGFPVALVEEHELCGLDSIKMEQQEIILDGAHNPAAIKELVATWREQFLNQQCTLIFGALSDKDWKRMLSLLEPIASDIILVPVSSTRTLSPDEIRKFFPKAMSFSSLKEALLKKSEKDLLLEKRSPAPILLTGSLFLVGEALALLKGRGYHPSTQ